MGEFRKCHRRHGVKQQTRLLRFAAALPGDTAPSASGIRLLLLAGARSSEITRLRWNWICSTRAVLLLLKTGLKAIQLLPPARAVMNAVPRKGRFVFPNGRGDGPMMPGAGEQDELDARIAAARG